MMLLIPWPSGGLRSPAWLSTFDGLLRPGVLVGALALIVIMLLGHWLEMRAIGQARAPWPPWRRSCPTRPNG